LPEAYAGRNVRVLRLAVPVGVVAVREHGADAGAADSGRVGDRRLREAASLQLIDAGVGDREHVDLGAEVQAPGRACLDARGLETDLHAVDAERAFGHLVRARRVPRHVERTARLAHLAADAGLGIHVHDAVLVLHDRA